jgi:hypothetical protein
VKGLTKGERKRVQQTILQTPLDDGFVHATDDCELEDMGVVTKHAFAPSLEKTQLMISQ